MLLMLTSNKCKHTPIHTHPRGKQRARTLWLSLIVLWITIFWHKDMPHRATLESTLTYSISLSISLSLSVESVAGNECVAKYVLCSSNCRHYTLKCLQLISILTNTHTDTHKQNYRQICIQTLANEQHATDWVQIKLSAQCADVYTNWLK